MTVKTVARSLADLRGATGARKRPTEPVVTSCHLGDRAPTRYHFEMIDAATSIVPALRAAYLALGGLLLRGKSHKGTLPPSRLKARGPLPIRPYFAGGAFDPGTICNMSLAFENVCEVLDITEGPATRHVAAKIIALTQSGERDVATLGAKTIQEFRNR
jgi:hypothetical protein